MTNVSFTVRQNQTVNVTHEDAVNYVIDFLRHPRQLSYSNYGYDLYLNTLLVVYFEEKHRIPHHDSTSLRRQISPLFMDACWELCRRGILRPFTHDIDGQSTSQGAGFSITAFGEQWLREENFDTFVPTEPGRFAEMLEPYALLFGEGFQERAQEAIRCYNAHAYLACCSMAGAAAETIIVKIADKLEITRTRNEPLTKTRDSIISKSDKGVKEGLIAYSDIVKYWRDEGMHHESWETRGEKAYISLAMLLRLAMFAKDKWFSSI